MNNSKKLLFSIVTILISTFINAQCPTITVTPISGTITCNGAPAIFNAQFSPTLNVSAKWIGNGGTPIVFSNTSPVTINISNPGTYTFVTTNNTNSCSTTQTVSVISSSIVPSMTINPVNGYTINCNNQCLQYAIIGSSMIAPITYTWTNLTTSVSISTANGGYTVCTPGNYLAKYRDGFGCTVSHTMVVSQDLTPTTVSITNSPTLICSGQNATLAASGAFTYTWNPTGIISSSINITPTVTTNYTVNASYSNTNCPSTNSSITQSVSPCTQIFQLGTEKKAFELFPNPNNGSFNILMEEFDNENEILIIDGLGKIVFRKDLSNSANNIVTNNLKTGLYNLLIVQGAKVVFTTKLSVENQ